MGYRDQQAQLEMMLSEQRAALEGLRDQLYGAHRELSRVGHWWLLRSALGHALDAIDALGIEHDGTVQGMRALVEDNEGALAKGHRALRRLDVSEMSARDEWFAELGARARRQRGHFQLLAVVVAGVWVWVAGVIVVGVVYASAPTSGVAAGVVYVIAALAMVGVSRFLGVERLLGGAPDATYGVKFLIDVRLGLVLVVWLALLVVGIAVVVCELAWWLG